MKLDEEYQRKFDDLKALYNCDDQALMEMLIDSFISVKNQEINSNDEISVIPNPLYRMLQDYTRGY